MLNNAHTQSADGSAVTTDLADPTLATAIAAVRAAEDRKGDDITLLRVTEVSYLADYFLIVTGFSSTQVRAIYQAIARQVEEQTQRLPPRVEGQGEGSWVLMDYGDLIVHILLPEEREFYNLEAFWGHAERVDWSEWV
ncbi:MAG: ribosome silencing factor [Limnospira sp.]